MDMNNVQLTPAPSPKLRVFLLVKVKAVAVSQHDFRVVMHGVWKHVRRHRFLVAEDLAQAWRSGSLCKLQARCMGAMRSTRRGHLEL
jgi:hypothetical protein